MKKLLAILLTLAMLVPMCGLAEENAPQATLTTITFRDFNGRQSSFSLSISRFVSIHCQ